MSAVFDDRDLDALLREAIAALISDAEFMGSSFTMHVFLSNGYRVEYDPAEYFRVLDEYGNFVLQGELPHHLNSGDQ